MNEIVSYYFVNYLPDIGYYVVLEVGYEWDNYKLIADSTGKAYPIEDEPHVSPDKKRIVAVSDGMVFREGGIFIWRLDNGIPTKEWAWSAAGTEFKKWNGNDSIVVEKRYKKEEITISRTGNEWRVDKPDALDGW